MVAVELLVHAVLTIKDVAPLLPVVMPELLRRMGHLPVVEPAEVRGSQGVQVEGNPGVQGYISYLTITYTCNIIICITCVTC